MTGPSPYPLKGEGEAVNRYVIPMRLGAFSVLQRDATECTETCYSARRSEYFAIVRAMAEARSDARVYGPRGNRSS